MVEGVPSRCPCRREECAGARFSRCPARHTPPAASPCSNRVRRRSRSAASPTAVTRNGRCWRSAPSSMTSSVRDSPGRTTSMLGCAQGASRSPNASVTGSSPAARRPSASSPIGRGRQASRSWPPASTTTMSRCSRCRHPRCSPTRCCCASPAPTAPSSWGRSPTTCSVCSALCAPRATSPTATGLRPGRGCAASTTARSSGSSPLCVTTTGCTSTASGCWRRSSVTIRSGEAICSTCSPLSSRTRENRSAAAAASHLSRSVFYQRITLIGDLLGADLDDGETIAALHLALLGRRRTAASA
ncbi:helix-turn-helix domain-containing protein [Microbacterium foliorum]|uniref:helix-turn-helix domain-containing protein n=1 Tax=Microbacterium foliorum TaxID=104336 RepID=UPI00286AEB87|nr:helix-turn-helix domain-containing protein [Microbacterium foliorum]